MYKPYNLRSHNRPNIIRSNYKEEIIMAYKGSDKIAILFRGPIRPDVDTCIFNLNKLKESFIGYNITTFVVAWENESSIEFQKRNIADHCLLLPMPTEEQIALDLKLDTSNDLHMKRFLVFGRNMYRQFISTHALLNLMNSKENYDWAVITRLDIKIKINPSLYKNDNAYTAADVQKFPINDQFGIGRPSIVQKAWDYENMDNMANLIKTNGNPEEVLQMQMKQREVTYKDANVIEYVLDAKRHNGFSGQE